MLYLIYSIRVADNPNGVRMAVPNCNSAEAAVFIKHFLGKIETMKNDNNWKITTVTFISNKKNYQHLCADESNEKSLTKYIN